MKWKKIGKFIVSFIGIAVAEIAKQEITKWERDASSDVASGINKKVRKAVQRISDFVALGL